MPAKTLPGGTFTMANGLTVTRMGYGAMQLAGPHVFGPPADRDAAVAVLREAVELGITHIDTSDYYGPYVTNELIKQALHPYPENLHLVTKVGAFRDARLPRIEVLVGKKHDAGYGPKQGQSASTQVQGDLHQLQQAGRHRRWYELL